MASTPQYYLQLVDRDGNAVTHPLAPTKHKYGTVSAPLIDEVLDRCGLWRTKARLRSALQEAIQAVKDEATYR